MKSNWQFKIPPKIIFGIDSSKSVGIEAKNLKHGKILIVTDKIMIEIGIFDLVKKSLEENQIKYVVYDGVSGEPTTEFVDEGLKLYKDSKCNIIIALGGGSPIDTAKAISAMTVNPGTIFNYKGLGNIKLRGAPLITIPTTAGTGSEVTSFTIITDSKTNVKMLIGSEHIIPNIAIVDPRLTLSSPRGLTASVGIDALTHAIEAYVSVKANPISDMFALSAIKLIPENLKIAFKDGKNLEAREMTMLGSMYAGIAFGNSSVALVHGMSRPIGAYFHVPHGVSNAALLGVVMDFSYIGDTSRYTDIAVAMGGSIKGLSKIETAKKAVKSVKELIKDLEIPTLKELGIDKKELQKLAPKMADAAIDSGSPSNNPRLASREEIVKLYMKAY